MKYVSTHHLRTKSLDGSKVAVRKDFDTTSESLDGSEHGERCIKFTISTSSVDRSFDSMDQDGWVLANYLRNPVVLFGHDAASFPIGKAKWIGVEDGKLKAIVQFVDASVPIAGQVAECVYQLCKDGFLNTTSVGFRALAWNKTSDPDRGAGTPDPGVDFHMQELLEFSIVTIPDNPEALIEKQADNHAVEEAVNETAETIMVNRQNNPQASKQAQLHMLDLLSL